MYYITSYSVINMFIHKRFVGFVLFLPDWKVEVVGSDYGSVDDKLYMLCDQAARNTRRKPRENHQSHHRWEIRDNDYENVLYGQCERCGILRSVQRSCARLYGNFISCQTCSLSTFYIFKFDRCTCICSQMFCYRIFGWF